jgi:hypothetical protein
MKALSTRNVLVLTLLAVLAGCGTVMIKADPNQFSVREQTKPLKPRQIALVNGYAAETKATIISQSGSTLQVDLRQVTDSAIQVMSRHLQKNGVTVMPQAAKTVTLSVKNVNETLRGMGMGGIRIQLDLEAKYSDGTSSLVASENVSPADAGRVLDGAVLFAVTKMLNDDRFVGYVNR